MGCGPLGAASLPGLPFALEADESAGCVGVGVVPVVVDGGEVCVWVV